MEELFDILGPIGRSASVSEALADLAGGNEVERGSVFTRSEFVEAILDLVGYTSDQSLHQCRLLEPSFGDGDFLIAALQRLLVAFKRDGGAPATAVTTLANAIRAVELHPRSFDTTARRIRTCLEAEEVSHADISTLLGHWLIRDDFLLTSLPGEFDFIVGNPPYVRQERIPAPLLDAYRARFRTMYDRADLYVAFFERSLDLLSTGGKLGFICANRWMKNKYGAPLREKIATSFRLVCSIDLEGVDAFHADVIAYPAITIIQRDESTKAEPAPARVPTADAMARLALPQIVDALRSAAPSANTISTIAMSRDSQPWLLDDPERLALLRRIEAAFPALEDAGCKVGIGVATGCDRAFIADFDAIPVESERKLPLVMARDLVDGELHWGGKGVVNPFNADGSLAALDTFPRFGAYIREHAEAIQKPGSE